MPSDTLDYPETLDIKEIIKILPHRYPFLLVDKILKVDMEKGYILGQKNLTINEAFFQGHFPGAPIMPGVLILEALAQTGAVLVHLSGQKEKVGVLLNVKNAKFRNPVKPGDILYLEGEGIHISSKGGKVEQ
ncbi:(3R)-hydroxymyristoyl-[acyl-carrier-protein] dehydratase, partial [Waddlia chondrophila 2032/99]